MRRHLQLLQIDLCLTYVSQNLEYFCLKRPDGSLCFREAVLFPQELADQLLAKMATEGSYIYRQCADYWW